MYTFLVQTFETNKDLTPDRKTTEMSVILTKLVLNLIKLYITSTNYHMQITYLMVLVGNIAQIFLPSIRRNSVIQPWHEMVSVLL
jgi:hypothetical protein